METANTDSFFVLFFIVLFTSSLLLLLLYTRHWHARATQHQSSDLDSVLSFWSILMADGSKLLCQSLPYTRLSCLRVMSQGHAHGSSERSKTITTTLPFSFLPPFSKWVNQGNEFAPLGVNSFQLRVDTI